MSEQAKGCPECGADIDAEATLSACGTGIADGCIEGNLILIDMDQVLMQGSIEVDARCTSKTCTWRREFKACEVEAS